MLVEQQFDFDSITFRDDNPSRHKTTLNTAMTRTVLKNVFDRGGFVAGGFARHLARHVFFGESFDDHFDGDVDIYFKNELDLDDFKRWLSSNSMRVSESITNSAFNVYINRQAQVITAFRGSVAEVLDTFDFVNVKAAFDDKRLYVDDRWQSYEQENELHVDDWNSVWLFTRIHKYTERRELKQSPEMKEKLADEVIKRFVLMRSYVDGSVDFPDSIRAFFHMDPKFFYEKHAQLIHKIAPALTNEQLLQIAPYIDTKLIGDKNPMMYELFLRQKKSLEHDESKNAAPQF
jgi:hypothetical protein